MPHLKKAELIEGVVYIGSPVRYDQHGQPHVYLVGWLFIYQTFTPGVGTADNSTVRLDLTNVPQPDGVMFKLHGGQVRMVDGYITLAPELAAEVSASSGALDLGSKFETHRRNGVREYIVWRVLDNDIDWFVLRGDQCERLLPDDAGILRGEVFPGLWLDKNAMMTGDLVRVHDVLQQGLKSAEHAAFAADLLARASTSGR